MSLASRLLSMRSRHLYKFRPISSWWELVGRRYLAQFSLIHNIKKWCNISQETMMTSFLLSVWINMPLTTPTIHTDIETTCLSYPSLPIRDAQGSSIMDHAYLQQGGCSPSNGIGRNNKLVSDDFQGLHFVINLSTSNTPNHYATMGEDVHRGGLFEEVFGSQS